jgi:hypothetical protein
MAPLPFNRAPGARRQQQARDSRLPEQRGMTAKALLYGFRLLLILLVVGLTTIIALERINAATSWFAKRIQPIAFAQSEPAGHSTYRLRLKKPVLTNRIFSLQIRLIDPGGNEAFYTPRAASVEEVGRGLFTVSHEKWLIFSRPDGFDLRKRNASARLVTPEVFPARLATWLTLFWLISVLGLVVIAPEPIVKPQILWARISFLLQAALRRIGRHPLLVLVIPSLYFFLIYPPLWKDIDALNQLVLPASASNILHFPALYCFLARIPMWVGDSFIQPRPLNLMEMQQPSFAGVYLLLAFQHGALAFALASLCRIIAADLLLRGVVVLLFACSSALYAQAHTCGSEAWGLIGLILVFALGLRIYYANKAGLWSWLAYFGALTLAIGSRHINVLLGFWGVALFVVLALAQTAFPKSCQWAMSGWWRGGIASVAFAAAASADYGVTLIFSRLAGVEPRTTLGRTLSDRMETFLDVLPAREREDLARKLEASTPDADVKAAIRDQVAIGSFYNGSEGAIRLRLANEGYHGEALNAKTDRVILSATLTFLNALHPALIAVIVRDFERGLWGASNASVALAPFVHNRSTGELRMQDPRLWYPLRDLRSTFRAESVAWLDRAKKDKYLSLGDRVNLGWIYMLASSFCILCCYRRRAVLRCVLPALTIMITGCVIFGATMVCEYYMSRYALPLQVSGLIGFSLALVGISKTFKASPREALLG